MLYTASYILIYLFVLYNFFDNPKLRKKLNIRIKHTKYSTINSTAQQKEILILVCCCPVSTCPMFVTALSTLERLTFTTESSCTIHSGRSSSRSSTIEQEPIWRSSNSPNDLLISSFQLVQRQLVQRQLIQRQLFQR